MNSRLYRIKRFITDMVLVTAHTVGKFFRGVNFYVLCVWVLLFWYLFTWNLKGFAGDAGYGINPYLLPHFFTSGSYGVYGALLLVLLTCDAPFLDRTRQYSISRTGRGAWAAGQILYIVTVNMIFQGIFLLGQVLTLIPFLSVSGGWGSVLYTAAKNPSVIAEYNGFGAVSGEIVSGMQPVPAVLLQMALCVLVGSLIGIVTFLINGLSRTSYGAVIMAGMVLLADYLSSLSFFSFADVSGHYFIRWLDIRRYITGEYQLWNNIAWLAGMFALFSALAWVCVKKGWIRTTE